jgi:hypothetical protein
MKGRRPIPGSSPPRALATPPPGGAGGSINKTTGLHPRRARQPPRRAQVTTAGLCTMRTLPLCFTLPCGQHSSVCQIAVSQVNPQTGLSLHFVLARVFAEDAGRLTPFDMCSDGPYRNIPNYLPMKIKHNGKSPMAAPARGKLFTGLSECVRRSLRLRRRECIC